MHEDEIWRMNHLLIGQERLLCISATQWKQCTISRIHGFIFQDNKITFPNNTGDEFCRVELSFAIYQHPSPCSGLSFKILYLHKLQRSKWGSNKVITWTKGMSGSELTQGLWCVRDFNPFFHDNLHLCIFSCYRSCVTFIDGGVPGVI